MRENKYRGIRPVGQVLRGKIIKTGQQKNE
jgi:hypothetical protein